MLNNLVLLILFIISVIFIIYLVNSQTDATNQIPQSNCNDLLKVTNITASGDDKKGNVPLNVNDSNPATRWSNIGIGSWIQLDLGTNKTVCTLEVAAYKGNERYYRFNISTSFDTNQFTGVRSYTSSGNSISSEKFDILPTKARYIRVLVADNSQVLNNMPINFSSISDIKVYGVNETGGAKDTTARKGVKNQTDIESLPSVSVRTESSAYFPGELIQISGTVQNGSGVPMANKRVDIFVHPENNPSNKIYRTTASTTTNGTFQNAGLRIDVPEYSSMWTSLGNLSAFKMDPSIVSKTYLVNVSTAIDGKLDSSWSYIQIRNNFLTPTNMVLYLGGFWLFLFLLVVWWPLKSDDPMPNQSRRPKLKEVLKMGRQFKAVSIFFFISAIVLSPIISFLLVDIETGKNSPLGIIKKETYVNGSRNIQWAMNVGGNPGNNFGSGIQIPIYILIFGIAGGYIRYLYDIYNAKTRKPGTPVIDHPKDESTLQVNKPVISGKADPLSTIIIFDGEVPILTTKADDGGFWTANCPTFPPGQHVFRAKATDDTTNSSQFSGVVKVTIQNNVPEDVPEAVPTPRRVMQEIMMHEIKENENMKLFKESIENLALIILSPLLAIAVWFILFQGGTTADYTLAAIGITTGFLIPEIVARLINFASPRVSDKSGTSS